MPTRNPVATPARKQSAPPRDRRQLPVKATAPAPAAQAAGKPQAAPGFVERRKSDRRAAARQPAVNVDALAAAVAERLRGLLAIAPAPVAAAMPQPAQTEEKEAPVIRNGVKCPEYNSVTGRLWLLYGKEGASTTLTRAKQLAKENGLNEASAAIALYSWRKFHGVKSPK